MQPTLEHIALLSISILWNNSKHDDSSTIKLKPKLKTMRVAHRNFGHQ